MALAEYLQQIQQQKAMHAAGADMLDVVKQGGLPALNAQTLADIAQKHNLAIDGLQSTLNLLQKSGAAQKALQEYQTEIQTTRKEGNQADYAVAETAKANAEKQTVDERRAGQVAEDWSKVTQNQSAADLNSAHTQEVYKLLPLKAGEISSRIDVNHSAAGLNTARTKTENTLRGAKLANEQSQANEHNAAAFKNMQGGDDNKVAEVIKATGAIPNAKTTYKGQTSEREYDPGQLQQIINTANAHGYGVNVMAYHDDNGNVVSGFITGYEPLTNGKKQTSNLPNSKQPKVGSVSGGGKELDRSTAAQILKEAGGDKAKARQIAAQRGYSF